MNSKSHLNAFQQQAVDHRGSHLLIIAGPGTGKTHTLTQRIAMMTKQLSSQQRILAVTFTNKAAEEMFVRLKNLCIDLSKVEVGTFHSFCLNLLRRYYREADISPDFQILDEERIPEILKNIWPNLSNRERAKIYDRITLYKSSQFDRDIPEEVLLFNNALNAVHVLDFEDILLKTYRLMKQNPEILKIVQNQYPYIFVDEYQDINAIQHALLRMWVGNNSQITAIGDPNQAIYGFRGSNLTFFESFRTDFQPSVQLSLNENFRSLSFIVEASNQIMKKSDSQYLPAVTSQIHSEGKLTIHRAVSDKAEAEFVVHTIEKLIGGTSMFSHDTKRILADDLSEVSFGDIAILYRLNSQAQTLREAFDRSGIPYHLSSNGSDDHVGPMRNYETDINIEKVSFLTLHASKGLEFPVVFILGCEDNLLPLNLEGLSSDLEEERRLFYVGITRAKYRLYLISANKRYLWGKIYQNKLSTFVNDIEESLKEEHLEKIKKKKIETQLSLFRN